MEKNPADPDWECCLGKDLFFAVWSEKASLLKIGNGGNQQMPGTKMFQIERRPGGCPEGRNRHS